MTRVLHEKWAIHFPNAKYGCMIVSLFNVHHAVSHVLFGSGKAEKF